MSNILQSPHGHRLSDVHCLAKAIVVLLILTAGTSADGNQFGVTGGTKGIGLKYSNFGKHFGVDIGAPIFFSFDKKTGDSIEANVHFKVDPYFAFSWKFLQGQKNEFAAGLSLFVTIGYKYKHAYDTLRAANLLYFDQAIGPCLQYMRKNDQNEKIFSFEVFPFSFFTNFRNSLKLSPNVQISVYMRK